MPVTKQDARIFAEVWMELPYPAQENLFRLSREYRGVVDREKIDRYRDRVLKTAEIVHFDAADGKLLRVESRLLELEAQKSDGNSGSLDIHRNYVGRRVREARCKKGWEQRELAEACGIHQSYISRIESGKFSSTYKTIAKLAEALGVSIYELDPSFDDVGERIRSIRRAQNISIGLLSQRTEISIDDLDQIENNVIVISQAQVEKIAEVLNVRETEIDPCYRPF